VLDKFRVCTTKFKAVEDKRDLKFVEKHLNAALQQEEFDFRPLLVKAYAHAIKREQTLQFQPRVVVDNSPEKHTGRGDRRTGSARLAVRFGGDDWARGLRHRLCPHHHRGGAAIDTFHITGPEARKIRDENRLTALRSLLVEVGLKRRW
jgi:hypothetical protein